MSNNTSHPVRIAWTTTPTLQNAQDLTHHFLQAGAACVQVDSHIKSYYHWNDTIQNETEFRLWIKYAPQLESILQDVLRANHPYQCPQWIAVDTASGLPEFAQWVHAQHTSVDS